MALQPNEIIDLAGLQKGIQDVRTEITGFGQDISSVISVLNTNIAKSKTELQSLVNTLKSINTSNSGASSQVSNTSNQVSQLSQNLQNLVNAQQQFINSGQLSREALNQLITAQKELAKQIKETITEDNKESQAMQDLMSKYKALSEQVNLLNRGLKENRKSTKDAVGSYNELQRSLSSDIKELKSLEGAFTNTNGKIKINSDRIKELTANIKQKQDALKQVDSQMGINTRNVGNYSSALRGFSQLLTGGIDGLLFSLGAVGASILAVKNALTSLAQASESMVRMNLTIRAVSSSSELFASNMAFLKDVSDKYGVSLDTLSDGYKLLAGSTLGTYLEGAKTQQIFLALTKATAGLKLESADTLGAIRALGQMFSKGAINSEELKSQLGDRLPGAMRILAEATGKTQAELLKMMEKGQLIANDFVPKLASGLEDAFGKNAQDNINTMSGAFERMSTQFKIFASENFGWVGDSVAYVLNKIADAYKLINNRGKNTVLESELSSFLLKTRQQQKDVLKFYSDREKTLMNQIQSSDGEQKQSLRNQRNEIIGYYNQMVKLYNNGSKQILQEEKAKHDAQKALNDKNLEELKKKNQKKHEQDIAEWRRQYQIELRALNAQEKEKLHILEISRVEGKITEDKYAEDRLKIRQEFNNKELVLANIYAKKDKEIAITLKDDFARINDDKQKSQLESTIILYKQLERELTSYLEFEKNALTKGNKDYESIVNQRLDIIDQDTASKIGALSKPRGKGKLGKPSESQNIEFNISKQMIEIEGLANKINAISELRIKSIENINQIYAQTEMEIMSRTEDNEYRRKALEEARLIRDKALEDIRRNNSTATFEHLKRLEEANSNLNQYYNDKEIADFAEKERKKQELLEGTFQLTNQLSETFFSISKGRGDAQLSMFEKQKSYEMELAGDNAEAKIQAEQKYDQKIREIKRKQAIADKAQAIFNIALNAAQAMTKVSAQTGTLTFIFSPLVAALSALQLATVLGTPIPEFKKGKKRGDSYEGLGIVGEAGAEIVERNGQQQVVSKPTLTYLDRDTTVYTPYETQRMLKDMDKVSNINKYSRMIDMNNSFSRKTEVSKQTQMQLALRQMSFNEKTITSAIHKGFSDINLWLNNQDGSVTRKRGNSTVKDITNRTIYYK